jgi:formate/nitrite transporter
MVWADDGPVVTAPARTSVDLSADGQVTAPASLDALLPPAMARKAEEVGAAKARLPLLRLFTLAVLGGAFIAVGADFSTVATTDAAASLGAGPARVLGGLVFSVGLVLVVVAGAELFTGNTLLVMACVARRLSIGALLRNWAVVYAGNMVGAVGIAWLVFVSGQHEGSGGAVGQQALDIAAGKVALSPAEAVARGVLANVLVCLAVWLCLSARTVTDKVVAIVLPISAFVAGGFEHSVANMYLLPLALFVEGGGPDQLGSSTGAAVGDRADLDWGSAIVDNLIPVTIGNIIGGAVLVGLVYAFVYRAPRPGSQA